MLGLMTLLAVHNARAAVSFTVSPSTISNTYTGTITLQVTGLTNGETVLVQKFLDANTNGAVDAGDVLWQQFQLADGSASVFHNGGTSVTNFNVPGDTDASTNGSITAKLYPSLDFSQVIVGKYLFILSSPTAHFSPLTNSFNVTNFPYAQSFSGIVVSNSTPVPNAIVILFQPSSGGGDNPKAGAVADNSGHYTIKAATGSYLLAAGKSNYVANLSASPNTTLTSGATITTNVPLTGATETISGNVVDLNSSSKGLAGYLVPLQTKDNLLAIAFTDANGNYSAGVTPDVWKVSGDSQGLAYKGYLGLDNKLTEDTTGGSVSGVTLALPKATAIFYGTVKDNHGNPLAGIDVYTSDQSGFYQSDGYTYIDGSYVALALNNGSDPWQVQVSTDNNPLNYVYSQGTNNVIFSSGQAVKVNFTALVATNTITGHVQDNTGKSLSNIGVNANDNNGYNAHADTDSNGNYTLYVANGDTWSVSLNCCDSCGDGLPSSYQCPDSQDVFINNDNGTANFTVQPAGGGGPYQIFGYVLDNSSNPVAGVDVHGSDTNNNVYTGTTDGSGYYSIGVGNGNWGVYVDCNELNGLGYQCPNEDFLTVSGNSVEADFTVQGNGNNSNFNLLYTFGSSPDGQTPFDRLLVSDGTLYGVTDAGGSSSNGTVFKINTDGSGYTILHNFPTRNPDTLTNGDGAQPYGGLAISGSTLYGTASSGGIFGFGTIFKLNTNGSGFAKIYDFGQDGAGGEPWADVLLSGNMLYVGGGDAFAITTNGTGFKDLTGNNSDAPYVLSGLTLSGNTLYGVGASSGNSAYGNVYKVNTDGTGFSVLHDFSAVDTNGYNSDGAESLANGETGGGSVLALSGNTLYGTAYFGGPFGQGTIFKINTSGSGFATIHNFDNNDGANPVNVLLVGNALYGTTASGGSGGLGSVFSMNTDGSGFTTLYSFTGSDGDFLSSGLVYSDNTLYGASDFGGNLNNGTIYSISLGTISNSTPLTILSISLNGTNLVLNCSNGQAGVNYITRMSSNLALPLNQWTPIATNMLNASGNFTITATNAVNLGASKRFYILEAQ